MKKLMILMIFFIAADHVQAQLYPAPPGSHYEWSIDKLNFHKPRTGCTRGFGFCIQGHWVIVRNSYFSTKATYIKGDKLVGYLTVEDKKVALHISTDIQNVSGYEDADFSSFTLEPGSDFTLDGSKPVTLKAGTYAVSKTKTEFVITLDTL